MKRCIFALCVMPWVILAALRVALLYSRLPLDETARRLREVRILLPRVLRAPLRLRALVDRLLPVLPPRRGGRCLKRSLILLDLWSRCALQPRFFMGVKAGERRPEGHAWLEADGFPPSEMDRNYQSILEI